MAYDDEKAGTATLGTQIFKYHPRDMFDTPQAADYEHGTTSDMEARWNKIREIYQRAGYRVETEKTTSRKVRGKSRDFVQLTKTFYVYNVPLKCLKGRKAKALLVHLWINQ